MKLIKPTKEHAKSWSDALREFEQEGVTGFWNISEHPKNIEEYIQRTEQYSQGEHLPDWFVPNTTYWLIDKEKFIGHVNIRHELNEKLKKEGGNIGYAIRSSEREKGNGKRILALALLKAQEIGLQKALVTCDETNIASQKIIESNRGVFEGSDQIEKKEVKRYWISLL